MKLFVTGTDTDVGKTIFSAALSGALKAHYWKPIQAGTIEHGDSDTIRNLSGNPPTMVLAEAYRLNTACSPHRAAELDSLKINADELQLPRLDPLVVEGAGGLLVPITRDILLVDIVARWQLPVVLVARTTLGTINHSLLSIEAIRSRNMPLLGIAFIGEPNPDSEEVICAFGGAKRLGRLPIIDPLDGSTLAQAFADNFRLEDFR